MECTDCRNYYKNDPFDEGCHGTDDIMDCDDFEPTADYLWERMDDIEREEAMRLYTEDGDNEE